MDDIVDHVWPRHWPQPLACLTTIIGLGAITAAFVSSIDSHLGHQIYGVSIRTSGSLRKQPSENIENLTASNILLHSLSVRNLVTGLITISLTQYWIYLQHVEPSAAFAARDCLGYSILIGTVVPLVDAYGAWSALRARPASGISIPPAFVVHCLRFLVWVVGGVWCLSG